MKKENVTPILTDSNILPTIHFYQLSTYFNSKGTIPLISLDELPIAASNLPSSAIHSCFASSKKLNAFYQPPRLPQR